MGKASSPEDGTDRVPAVPIKSKESKEEKTESQNKHDLDREVNLFYDKGVNARKPPHSVEIEQLVLSSILIDGDSIEKAIEVFGGDREKTFYSPHHQLIYKAMLQLYQSRDPIDVESAAVELEKGNNLEKIGGAYQLALISTKVATSANIEFYARVVKEKYLYRRLIKICAEMGNTCYDERKDVFELIDKMSKDVFDISQSSIRKPATKIEALIKKTVASIQDLKSRKDGITGVSSGFQDLDKLTAGFQDSDLIIIAARPSTGKTGLALNFARNAAVDGKKAVLFFSLEMAEQQLGLRLICSEAKVDAQRVRVGRIDEDELNKVITKIDPLAYSELYIDDTAAVSILELTAKARRLKQEKDIGMVIVDYLQLVTPIRDGRMNREQEIAQISRMLKALAKELNIPVIALAQLNRAIEQRTGEKKPQLSDLRESGSIEQDADVVVFLSRPESYGMMEFPDGISTKDVIEVIVGKQRNGPTGDIRLKFLKQFGRFESLTSVYGSDDFMSLPKSYHDQAKKSVKGIEGGKKHMKNDHFDSDDAPF